MWIPTTSPLILRLLRLRSRGGEDVRCYEDLVLCSEGRPGFQELVRYFAMEELFPELHGTDSKTFATLEQERTFRQALPTLGSSLKLLFRHEEGECTNIRFEKGLPPTLRREGSHSGLGTGRFKTSWVAQDLRRLLPPALGQLQLLQEELQELPVLGHLRLWAVVGSLALERSQQ